MNESRHINIADIGEVLLERSLKARRMSITVRPLRGVRVAVPRGFSFEQAAAFATSRRGWILKHQNRMKEQEETLRRREAAAAAIDREAAKKLLTARLAELAERHGFRYNKVSIRRQRTRWGSCSAANNISLNIRLVTLPEELRDYVLLHELAHTRIKNHGPLFWQEIDKLTGDGRKLAARLRAYGYIAI